MNVTFVLSLAVVTAATPRGPTPRPCERELMSFVADTTLSNTQLMQSFKAGKPFITAVSKSTPEYPRALREAHKEGRVVSTFVVDTTGRVIMNTAEIRSETDPDFGRAVCEFLAHAKFSKVIIDGRTRSVRITDVEFGFTLR